MSGLPESVGVNRHRPREGIMSTHVKLKLAGLFSTIANIVSIVSIAMLGMLTSVATLALFAMLVAGSPAAASATHQVPPRLDGQWATRWSGGTEHLRLYGTRFKFFFNRRVGLAAKGRVSVTGHMVTFYRSNQCNGTGTYKWSRSKRGLTFVQAPGSSDFCPRKPILTSRTWTHR
jgi:hypothetical protein